jgi:uncharacterized protein (TIGR02246 family)
MNGLVRFIAAIVLAFILTSGSNIPAMASTSTTTAISEIHQVLDLYIEGWTKSDANTLKSIWATDYPEATYLPVESTEVIKGIDNIDEYYDRTVPYFPLIGVNLKNIATDVFGEYAHVSCNTDFIVKTSDGSQVTLHPRLSFTLEHQDDHWSIVHYAESATIQS